MYTTEITELTSKLRNLKVQKGLLKDKKFNQNRIKLIASLEDFSFKGINELRNFFLTNKKGLYQGIINIINQHEDVFEWEFHSSKYIEKVQGILKYLKTKEIYKFTA